MQRQIALTKSAFLKAPTRTALFKEMCPGVPLPPEPVVTRWGTWLQAASYYARYFDNVRNVINVLPDQTDAARTLRALFNVPRMQEEFAIIRDLSTFVHFA